jgi:hypothetical protein
MWTRFYPYRGGLIPRLLWICSQRTTAESVKKDPRKNIKDRKDYKKKQQQCVLPHKLKRRHDKISRDIMTALEMTTLKITYLCPCFFRKGIMIR